MASDASCTPSLPSLALKPAFLGSFASLFAIDPRALIALRVGLGLLILLDLGDRASDLRVFYTDEGVLPRAALREPDGALPPFCIHLLGGSTAAAAVLFAFAALAAAALAAGLRPRIAALVSWALALSLQNRNPTLLSGGDVLLSLLLLWSALAPVDLCGARRVAEPGVGGRSAAALPLLSAGTAALLVQVASVYLATGLVKALASPAWRDGTAVALALEDVAISRWGEALRDHPGATRALTRAVLGLELLAPLLLFSPVRTGPVRTAVVAALLALHAGIALCLEVGIFPWVSAVALVVFVPPWVWDRLRVPIPARHAEPPPRWRERLTAALLVLGLWSNLGSALPAVGMPRRLAAAAEWLGLAQDWSMYVDLREPSGWFSIQGVRLDGSEVPLLKEGAPLDLEEHGDAMRYKNRRWHAYMGAIARREGLRRLLAEHLCRAEPMVRIEIRFECLYFCSASADVPPPPPLELIPCLERRGDDTGAAKKTGVPGAPARADWASPRGSIQVDSAP